MPSGKTVIVERVLNGGLVQRFSEQMAPGSEVLVLDSEDHVHLVVGTAEELVGIGMKDAPKPTAKKTTAKPKVAK